MHAQLHIIQTIESVVKQENCYFVCILAEGGDECEKVLNAMKIKKHIALFAFTLRDDNIYIHIIYLYVKFFCLLCLSFHCISSLLQVFLILTFSVLFFTNLRFFWCVITFQLIIFLCDLDLPLLLQCTSMVCSKGYLDLPK